MPDYETSRPGFVSCLGQVFWLSVHHQKWMLGNFWLRTLDTFDDITLILIYPTYFHTHLSSCYGFFITAKSRQGCMWLTANMPCIGWGVEACNTHTILVRCSVEHLAAHQKLARLNIFHLVDPSKNPRRKWCSLIKYGPPTGIPAYSLKRK